jgi:multiple antibiotic resistance protein
MTLFLIAFGALFSVMNPLGTVPVLVGLTQDMDHKARSGVALRASINVLVILILSFFLGQYILTFFGISLVSLKIAGGLIIASSGFALLTGKFNEHKGLEKRKVKIDISTRSEISLTPLAIPMLAGPGTISLLITYNQEYQQTSDIIWLSAAMVFTTICIYGILRSSHFIVRMLGASGINGLSRIIGFIVIAIGVEYIISSAIQILQNLELNLN